MKKNKILFERYKIVFLYRENPIEAAMSLALARKTSVFRKIYAQKEYFKNKFILDPEVVLELTLQAQKHYKYLEQIENPFVLSYEKLYSSDEETKYSNIEKLCDFAGIKITNDLIVKYSLFNIHLIKVISSLYFEIIIGALVFLLYTLAILLDAFLKTKSTQKILL